MHLNIIEIIDLIHFYIITPLGIFLNLVSIIIIYKKIFKGSISKYFYIIYLFNVNVSLIFSFIYYKTLQIYSNKYFCHILQFLTNVILQWNYFSLILMNIDRLYRMKRYKYEFLKDKIKIFKAYLLFYLFTILLNMYQLILGRLNFNKNTNLVQTNYSLDCQVYNRDNLLYNDYIELLLNMILPFSLLIVLNIMESRALIESKKV